MRFFGKGKCKLIANFSAKMMTSLPSISLSLSLYLSLSHRAYLTHNIGSASALPIIRRSQGVSQCIRRCGWVFADFTLQRDCTLFRSRLRLFRYQGHGGVVSTTFRKLTVLPSFRCVRLSSSSCRSQVMSESPPVMAVSPEQGRVSPEQGQIGFCILREIPVVCNE